MFLILWLGGGGGGGGGGGAHHFIFSILNLRNGGCFFNQIFVPKSKRMQDNAVLFYSSIMMV